MVLFIINSRMTKLLYDDRKQIASGLGQESGELKAKWQEIKFLEMFSIQIVVYTIAKIKYFIVNWTSTKVIFKTTQFVILHILNLNYVNNRTTNLVLSRMDQRTMFYNFKCYQQKLPKSVGEERGRERRRRPAVGKQPCVKMSMIQLARVQAFVLFQGIFQLHSINNF